MTLLRLLYETTREERDEAQAEIALIRPVVDAAVEYVRLYDEHGHFGEAHHDFLEATRAYREATK